MARTVQVHRQQKLEVRRWPVRAPVWGNRAARFARVSHHSNGLAPLGHSDGADSVQQLGGPFGVREGMDRLPEGHGELRFQSVLRPNKEYGKVRTLRQGERHVRVLLQPEPGTAPECQPVPFEQLSGDVLQRRKHPRLELPPVQEQPGGDQEAGHLAASLDSGGPLQAVLR
uniref:(northern house mosquito) hypothetical protein n=1 Tax=Culex pipiens TaxID=7175 RepID=A0A8D8MR25_CULPI